MEDLVVVDRSSSLTVLTETRGDGVDRAVPSFDGVVVEWQTAAPDATSVRGETDDETVVLRSSRAHGEQKEPSVSQLDRAPEVATVFGHAPPLHDPPVHCDTEGLATLADQDPTIRRLSGGRSEHQALFGLAGIDRHRRGVGKRLQGRDLPRSQFDLASVFGSLPAPEDHQEGPQLNKRRSSSLARRSERPNLLLMNV